MKKIFTALLLCITFINSCTQSKSVREKFNELKNVDYSEFKDLSIAYRKGVFFVTFQGVTYKIDRNLTSKKITSIKIAFSEGENENALLTEKCINYFENILRSFDKIGILALSVDNKENILLALPWNDRCTYFFLRLSPINSLEDIKKQYYKHYEDKWYMDKACS